MSFKLTGRGGPDQTVNPSFADHLGHGGLFATIVSAVALLFSALSYYESSLKTAELSIYVPPMIHYGRDGDSDVFNVPITIANDGARTGTVLSMELEVENLRTDAGRRRGKFHSAFLGNTRETTKRSAARSPHWRLGDAMSSLKRCASIRWTTSQVFWSMIPATTVSD